MPATHPRIKYQANTKACVKAIRIAFIVRLLYFSV